MPDTPSASPGRPEPEFHRMARLAGGAAQVLRLLRLLRRARDDGAISSAQYEAAVDAIESDPAQKPGP